MTIYSRSEELVSRCVECDLAEPESLASLGGSAPGVVDGILSTMLSAMYAASILEMAISSWSLETHWIRHQPTIKTYPVQDYIQRGSCGSSAFHCTAKSALMKQSTIVVLEGQRS